MTIRKRAPENGVAPNMRDYASEHGSFTRTAATEALDGLPFARGINTSFCPVTPYPFESIGRWYWIFPQVTDEAVREALAR